MLSSPAILLYNLAMSRDGRKRGVMDERRFSLKEAQQLLGVSERTIHRWIHSGKLKSYKPGRDHQIPESAIRDVIEGSEVYPKDASPSLFNSLGGEGLNLNAAYWIENLNAQAELVEHIIAAGGYGLETIWKVEGAAREFWGTYSHTVKRLVREWCTPTQAEALAKAETRMKEARSAATRAYLERREAEKDPRIVDELEAKRRTREARYGQDEPDAVVGT